MRWNFLPWERWWFGKPREQRARMVPVILAVSFVVGVLLYYLFH
jgi:hypothetical protein